MSPTASTSTSEVGPQRREKEKTACAFCFRRKVKCDLQQPCGNCQKAHRECVPVTRTNRPRPTNDRIETLEEANTKLEGFLDSLSRLDADAVTTALARWRSTGDMYMADGNMGIPSSPHQAESVNGGGDESYRTPLGGHYFYDQNGRISAHGPTSAFFDAQFDQYQTDFGNLNASNELSEASLKEQATMHAAQERHMEILNLASGKLDFDEVPADLAMHLLALHWNRQHFAFLISYRPLFTRDMAVGGPYFSRLLLNAMFFSVSKFSNRPEVYDDPNNQKTAGQRFLRRVKQLLGEALDQSSIPTVQAMLLLSSSMFALGYQSAAWLYHGIAVQMIFDLGLNFDSVPKREGPNLLTPAEYEIRRRIVWAAFIYDKIISLYQGRPVSFDEERMRVPHRFLDWHEEQDLWTPFAYQGLQSYPGAPARAVSTFTCLCSLSVIMGRIITQIYAEKQTNIRPGASLNRLAASLDRWKQSVPVEITFEPLDPNAPVPPPHVLSLHMVYFTLVILLHRPFVESANSSDPATVTNCWAKCEEAAKGATSMLSRYRTAFSLARAPYLISYATFVAATIHTRVAAQRPSSSESSRLLRICLDGLSENSATNPGVKRMYQSISSLMAKLGVNIASVEEMDVGASSANAPSVDTLASQGLDLDAIIRSFGSGSGSQSQSSRLVLPNDQSPFESTSWGTAWDGNSVGDNLFGFLGLQWNDESFDSGAPS